ncbi:hypothetical protein [Nostoc sp.]|uniref:hypothetical protein n=1 Tax=Nostoc sp. TaxID=1180 RepID=UPI002FF8E366
MEISFLLTPAYLNGFVPSIAPYFPSASDAPEFYKTGQYRPPLSWRLTDKEKKAIKEGWTAIITGKTIKKSNTSGTKPGICKTLQTAV